METKDYLEELNKFNKENKTNFESYEEMKEFQNYCEKNPQNGKIVYELDKYKEKLDKLVDQVDCNSFKDNIPSENKDRMYRFIKAINAAAVELDKFRDSLYDDEYGNNLKNCEEFNYN